jgi:hypothetical protein
MATMLDSMPKVPADRRTTGKEGATSFLPSRRHSGTIFTMKVFVKTVSTDVCLYRRESDFLSMPDPSSTRIAGDPLTFLNTAKEERIK